MRAKKTTKVEPETTSSDGLTILKKAHADPEGARLTTRRSQDAAFTLAARGLCALKPDQKRATLTPAGRFAAAHM